MSEPYLPLLELTRGRIIESVHYGAMAVVESSGRLLYSYGDPQSITFLRSSAKPFQALPFFERGGPAHFGLSPKEQALLCASHEGSDEHVRTVEGIQAKVGIKESDLQCGVHMPGEAAAYKALIARGEKPTPNRNNCSGKHSGMLACAKMRGLPLDTYLRLDHPIQQEILTTLSQMGDYPMERIEVGIDGCSAPNFALPLYNAALAYARLCDPQGMAAPRAAAVRQITAAMTSHPEMVSGIGEFDCVLMQAGAGQIVCKRGAEGFQALALRPGVSGVGERGVGIAFKVTDGDQLYRTIDIEPLNRVRPAVTLEILRQMDVLTPRLAEALAAFGPSLPIKNHRGLIVGQSRPVFQLVKGTQV